MRAFFLQTRGQKTRDGFILVCTAMLLLSWWGIYAMTLLLDRSSIGLAFEQGPDASILVALGAKIDPLISQGETHRLVLSPFLHSGFEHVLVNSFWLVILAWVFGRLGKTGLGFAVIFLAGGVIGQLASYLLASGPSVGASGGIYGLLGALLSSAWSLRPTARSRVLSVALGGMLLLAPLLLDRVDHASHAAGIGAGVWLDRWLNGADERWPRMWLPSFVISCCLLLSCYGFWSSQREVMVPPLESPPAPFALERCERLGQVEAVPCVFEPNVVFAAQLTLTELNDLEPLGHHEIPRPGGCHAVTRRNQNIIVRRIDLEHVMVLATDAELWPRFSPSIRRFIDGRCPGT